MDAFLQGVLVYIAQYLVVVLLGFMLANWASRGMLWTISKARMSARKGGVLVRVNSPLRSYFRIGHVDGDFLTYKNRAGKTLKLTVPQNAYRDFIGLKMIETDELSNNVLTADFQVVPGHDAEKTNNLFVRILTLPKKVGSKDWILYLIIIAIGIVSLYNAYKLGKVQEAVNALASLKPVIQQGSAVLAQ